MRSLSEHPAPPPTGLGPRTVLRDAVFTAGVATSYVGGVIHGTAPFTSTATESLAGFGIMIGGLATTWFVLHRWIPKIQPRVPASPWLAPPDGDRPCSRCLHPVRPSLQLACPECGLTLDRQPDYPARAGIALLSTPFLRHHLTQEHLVRPVAAATERFYRSRMEPRVTAMIAGAGSLLISVAIILKTGGLDSSLTKAVVLTWPMLIPACVTLLRLHRLRRCVRAALRASPLLPSI